MKKLLLVIPLLLGAVFVWLGTMKQPVPTSTVEKPIPAAQILAK